MTAYLSPFHRAREVDVGVLLDWLKEESGRQAAQVGHHVVQALLGEVEQVEGGHQVALALRQQLLQQALFEEAPGEGQLVTVQRRLTGRGGEVLLFSEERWQQGSHHHRRDRKC